jgi:hypothetical protein
MATTKKSTAAKAKAAPAKAKPAAAKAAPAAKRNGALDPTSKFIWNANAENPFKKTSGAYERVEIMKKLSGNTVAHIKGYRGLRKTTLATCLRMGLGRVG